MAEQLLVPVQPGNLWSACPDASRSVITGAVIVDEIKRRSLLLAYHNDAGRLLCATRAGSEPAHVAKGARPRPRRLASLADAARRLARRD